MQMSSQTAGLYLYVVMKYLVIHMSGGANAASPAEILQASTSSPGSGKTFFNVFLICCHRFRITIDC